MKSSFPCPACNQPLAREEHPPRSKTNPRPYIMLFCENPRCPSDAARNDGGSAETEGRAYVSLCNAIDNETESECDPIAKKNRDAWAAAEHANDLERSGGA
jgi:hypothetical protein